MSPKTSRSSVPQISWLFALCAVHQHALWIELAFEWSWFSPTTCRSWSLKVFNMLLLSKVTNFFSSSRFTKLLHIELNLKTNFYLQYLVFPSRIRLSEPSVVPSLKVNFTTSCRHLPKLLVELLVLLLLQICGEALFQTSCSPQRIPQAANKPKFWLLKFAHLHLKHLEDIFRSRKSARVLLTVYSLQVWKNPTI